MSEELGNLDRAGRLIKLLGWISLLVFLAVGVGVLIPFLNSGGSSDEILFFVTIFTALFGVSLVLLAVGSAIKRNRRWAKLTGSLFSLISLFAVPIGTVIGIFAIYYLYNGWDEKQQTI